VWSPDGTRVAFDRNAVVYVVNAYGTGLARVVQGSEPSWSPDGRSIAFAGRLDVFVVDLSTHRIRPLIRGASSPAWGPDGTATPARTSTPSASPSATSSSSPPPPGWVHQTDDSEVSIDTPEGWTFNGDPVPGLAGPPMLFGVGTGAFPTGGDCAPTEALKALSSDGALFVLIEYTTPGGEPFTFPPRPDHLDLGPLGGPSECWGVKNHTILFEDGGRYFQAQVVLGPDAPATLQDQVTESLDTLQVDPAPASEQPAALCREGHWTFCPQAAWVYEVMTRAGVFLLGPRGDQAILGAVGKHSFALWTSTTRPRALEGCQKMPDARVCRSGKGLVWEAQGVWLWVEPAPSPYASLRTTPALPKGSTLQRLVVASLRAVMPS